MKKVTLDADTYRINFNNIAHLTKDKTPSERIDFIGELAVITGVPIIITCVYLGELYGFSEQLESKIQLLKTFYGIDEVVNRKESTYASV
jgi:hypothetical protein